MDKRITIRTVEGYEDEGFSIQPDEEVVTVVPHPAGRGFTVYIAKVVRRS